MSCDVVWNCWWILYEIAWAVWEASRIWLKSTEVCSNLPRRSRGGFEQTSVDFSFQIHRGLSKSTEAKPRWIWTTRGEFEQHLARSQGSKARLNSPRRSRGEFNLAEDPWDRDKCFQMLRGLLKLWMLFCINTTEMFIDLCLTLPGAIQISFSSFCTSFFLSSSYPISAQETKKKASLPGAVIKLITSFFGGSQYFWFIFLQIRFY